MTGIELMQKLRTDAKFNPWIDLTKKEDVPISIDDVDSINIVNEGLKDECKLRIDIMPQPFIGSPTAPLWVLMKNPGLTALDYYDFVSVQDWDVFRLNVPWKKWHVIKRRNLFFRHGGEDIEAEMLAKRRKLALDQLTFSGSQGAEFYYFDECFKTYQSDGGRQVNGGQDWYNQYFCTEEMGVDREEMSLNMRMKILSRKVFVLDCCPYHSCVYDDKFWPVLTRSKELWTKLVQFALENEKNIIVRGTAVLLKVKDVNEKLFQNALSKRKIGLFKSKNAYLSANNLVFPASDEDRGRFFSFNQ